MPHQTASHTRRLRWLLVLPKAGAVLLLAATFSLLWLLHHNEQDEARSSLIKDVLWLEQNFRFHLDGNQEQLQQLASELALKGEHRTQFDLRAGHLVRTDNAISAVIWLDARQHIQRAQPAAPAAGTHAVWLSAASRRASESARRLGKAVYSEPFVLEGGGSHFSIAIPIYDAEHYRGSLIALYPMDSLLGMLVPWWFTEKYQVEIRDASDLVHAAKSHVRDLPGPDYALPLEPPGYGLKLAITAYTAPGNTLQRVLAGTILVLAIGVFWSLWVVRNLMQQRSQAEEALRTEHAFRMAMENSLTVGMRARDLTGRIIYVNPAFCRMVGYSSEELVGRSPPMPYWVPEEINETLALHQAVLDGEAPPDGFELNLMRKNGERFQALIYEAPLIDSTGQQTGWMASVLDVTERRHAEELARQQQEQLQFTARLVTMGEMASTLAHELNQPLAAIASYNTGCLNLLAQPGCAVADIQPALEKISVQAQRAGRIIRQVHNFVRKSEPKRAPCQIDEVIEDCMGFFEAEARKRGITLSHRPGTAIPAVLADRLMLEQVLLNLIRNGADAMAATPEEERLLGITSRCLENEIEISVSDCGCGLSPEVRNKLFSAFFTTKSEGMGIGLSICRSIIEFHRGRLWADDGPDGRGTTFHFTLPLDTP